MIAQTLQIAGPRFSESFEKHMCFPPPFEDYCYFSIDTFELLSERLLERLRERSALERRKYRFSERGSAQPSQRMPNEGCRLAPLVSVQRNNGQPWRSHEQH